MKHLKPVVLAAVLAAWIAPFPLPARDLSLQARASYFGPSDAVFREIYGYRITWGGELGFRLSPRLAGWAGADYYVQKGKLRYTEDDTKIRIVPLTAGLKYFFLSGRWKPYAGAGIAYMQFRETNSIGTVEKGGLGLVGRAGVRLEMGTTFFLDIQAGWSTCKVKPLEVEADLGGFSLGLGLGFEF